MRTLEFGSTPGKIITTDKLKYCDSIKEKVLSKVITVTEVSNDDEIHVPQIKGEVS